MKRKVSSEVEGSPQSDSSGGSSDIMVATASNRDLIVSVEESLTSASNKKVALLSISNQRPDTALGKTQGDHVTAYRSFIEMLVTAVEGVPLRKAAVIISNTFKALLPEGSNRFDEILKNMAPQIARIPSSNERKEIIQALRDTGNYDKNFLSNHNEIMKSYKRSVLMSIVRETGQEFIKQINLNDETAFRKEGQTDKTEGPRVKKAIHGLKAVNDLKAVFDESDPLVKETRMDRFYKKYIETSAPYKDGANAIFGEKTIKLLNKKWDSSIYNNVVFFNNLYRNLNKDKVSELFGDLFDFKYETHGKKAKSEELLYKVTAKHIVTMFRAFDDLQSFDNETKQQIINRFIQKEILQDQGWSNHIKRDGTKRVPMNFETLKEGVGKHLNLEENRMFSEEEIEEKKESARISSTKSKRQRKGETR